MLPVSGAEQFSASDANADLAELLGDRRVVEVGELRAGGVGRQVREEHVPQPALACRGLELVEHRRVAVVAERLELLVVLGLVRVDVVVHEADDVLASRALPCSVYS